MKKTLILIIGLLLLLLFVSGCKGDISKDEGEKLKSYLTLQDAPEEARPYLQGTKKITAADIIRLSKKGDKLSIEDLKDFRCDFFANSSSYIFEYRLSDNLVFDFSTDLKNPEDDSALLLCDSDSTAIDIRDYEDIEAYISQRLEK